MYTILLLEDGSCECIGRIQDGTERWTDPSLDAAIKHMKRFAKAMNGMKIKKKDIEFLRRQSMTEFKLVPFKP